ncbi:P0 protein [Cowpea polerovirus 1]|uniref:p0 protein n=1 Tax=Cowpea polerovirus 1 TaxID=1913124 RepID=A0A1I9W789_9VIRU|nr:P0 protein [Cowpea polerovirus 1]APA23040.1 P0 protein [Cowpea polerovirus 1]AQV03227.1 P0 protein [Cowpea polerovirus 1]
MFVTVPLGSGALQLTFEDESLPQRLEAFNLALLYHLCQNVYSSNDQLCSFIFLLPFVLCGVDLHDAWRFNRAALLRFSNLLGVTVESDLGGTPRVFRAPHTAREDRAVRRENLLRTRSRALGVAVERHPEILSRGRYYFTTFLAICVRDFQQDDSYLVRRRPRAVDPRVVLRDLRDILHSLAFYYAVDDARFAAIMSGFINENFHPDIAVCFRRLVGLPDRRINSSNYKTAMDLFQNSVLQAIFRN